MQSLHLTLWDEERRRLVTFRDAWQLQPQARATSIRLYSE
jgi:hypothetical protein